MSIHRIEGHVKPGIAAAAALSLIVAAGFLMATALSAGEEIIEESRETIEMSPISGPLEQPRRHFRLRSPAHLAPDDATEIYEIISGALSKGYRRSGLPAAKNYQRWRRYNRTPYLSSSHGNHYLNNYANAAAAPYGSFEKAGELPAGSVIAKDSFTVTETGGILMGPLFIMEKMPKGFNYVSGDWRYTLVLPDGTVLGRTGGEGAGRVQHCISCHLAVDHQDHLYFIPEPYRLESGK